MIVICDYQPLPYHPKWGGVNADSFGALDHCFDADPVARLAAVWADESSESEPKFALYGFEQRLKLQLDEPIIYAKFEPRAQQIWLARRDSDEQITILIYSYDGTLRANASMDDELGGSDVWMDELPEAGAMAVELGAGQDGCRSFLLRLGKDGLKVTAKLDDDLIFLFLLNSRQEAVLMNYYKSEIFIASYPNLKPLRKFSLPDEIMLDGQTSELMCGQITPLTDRLWLIDNDAYFRHYLFDARELKFIAEIALAGFEPTLDKINEITSPISAVELVGDKFIFTHCKLVDKGERSRLSKRYFAADAARVKAQILENLKTKI